MPKLNVCLINDSFPPEIDGVANAVTNYAQIITEKFGSAVVVTPDNPEADDSVYPFPVVRYPSVDMTKLVGYRAGFPFSAAVQKTLEAGNFDIIHSHCPITSTMLARSLRDRIKVPVVMTYHTKFDIDIANAIRGKLLQEEAKALLAANISACDEVWTVSRGAGENLRAIGYEGDYIVMPNGVDFPQGRVEDALIAQVTEGYDLPENVPVFLFVGRMMWYKGIRIILEGLAKLRESGQDFRMVFVGGGNDKDEIVALTEKLGLSDRVFFSPPIHDRNLIRAWYCRADMFLFPSTFDTNGLVVREAAACALGSVLVAGSCAAEDVTDRRECRQHGGKARRAVPGAGGDEAHRRGGAAGYLHLMGGRDRPRMGALRGGHRQLPRREVPGARGNVGRVFPQHCKDHGRIQPQPREAAGACKRAAPRVCGDKGRADRGAGEAEGEPACRSGEDQGRAGTIHGALHVTQ